jgi:hypothetical protein
MLWLPACARARHSIVVLFPEIIQLYDDDDDDDFIDPSLV